MSAVCEAPNPKSIIQRKRKLETPHHKSIHFGKFLSDDDMCAKKINFPDMENEVDEVLRLMRRKPAEKQHDKGCLVCGGEHFKEDCPCFEKIPPSVELAREYDQVCIGCGKIGAICCSEGAYAVLRGCGACGCDGHWHWEDKCDKDYVPPYEIVDLSFFKDLLAAEQSSLQKKEEDQVMVDLGKDNQHEDDYGKEGDGAKALITFMKKSTKKFKNPGHVASIYRMIDTANTWRENNDLKSAGEQLFSRTPHTRW